MSLRRPAVGPAEVAAPSTGTVDGTSEPAPPSSRRRWPEIDWLKGLAILFVLLIHAQPLTGTAIFEYVINRAVPVFLVLFGTTSELWWQSRSRMGGGSRLLEWYRTRLVRLMVPVWGMLAVWWTFTIVFRSSPPATVGTITATLCGYLPWVGTGWFVTLILELVVLFPFVRWCTARAGIAACLAASLAILVFCYYFMNEIVTIIRPMFRGTVPETGLGAYYPFWIFAPAKLFNVVAGIAIARRTTPVTKRDAAIAIVIVAGGALLHERIADSPQLRNTILAVTDVPLAIALLVLISALRVWIPAARALAWCGGSSWGIYLGQMIVHTSFGAVGFTLWAAPIPQRWAYFGALLVGAIGFVEIGTAIRSEPVRNWWPRWSA